MDRISSLPNDVILHILSFLPTKHAVATSILSSRWINLWDSLQILDLDDSIYLRPERKEISGELFLIFVDKVLSVNKSPTIVKFRLRICDSSGEYLSRINGWIHNVLLRNVVEIDLSVFLSYPTDDDRLRISPCQSLEIVKVDCDYGLYMPTSGCFFPNLRIFDVRIALDETDDELTLKLFPSLPRLEKLSLCGDLTDCHGEAYINITGTSLKILDLELSVESVEDCDAMVMIDAPHLEVLRLKDCFLPSYLVKNRPTLNEIKLDVGDDSDHYLVYMHDVGHVRINRLVELLQSIINAESLSISASTMLAPIFAHNRTLPVFHSLTKLELVVYTNLWVLLLHWLESSPNLKFLVLIIEELMEDIDLQGEIDWSLSNNVPPCLSLSLTEIEVKRLGKIEEELVLKYLLQNAKVLDKFTVNSHVYLKDGVLQ